MFIYTIKTRRHVLAKKPCHASVNGRLCFGITPAAATDLEF